MKKVIVVGAGVAGMSAGIYALQSGFDVTIFEQHSLPGGNCTSWKRKGYLFEGALHWLTGSSKDSSLYQVWRNVGAIKDATNIYIKDIFYTYYHNGQAIHLYCDPDRLERHFLEISPEDAKEIKLLCKDVRCFMKVSVPVLDVKGVKVRHKNKMGMSMLLGLLPILPKMSAYDKMSVLEYSQRFQHPGIRALLLNVVGANLKASSLFFTLGCVASGDGGYLEGGSLVMTQNMSKRFIELGGKIEYSSHVEKVIVEDDKASGVIVKGQRVDADAVIIAIDTLTAAEKLFERPLNETWIEKMRKDIKFMACTFIGIGVETDLSSLPQGLVFPVERPFTFAGETFYTFSLNNYAHYKDYAPKGCSALTTCLMGDTYAFWKGKKESGEYEMEKEKLAKLIISLVEQNIPQASGKIAVVDVATPLTYERYCGTKHGSWMTLQEKGDKSMTYPSVSDTVKQLYFAGQRLQTPGGLPVAVDTGRKAVQYLCRDIDTIFQGKMNEAVN